MALITRCPVCGTQFKVVPDQLRISEGWVRCGQCAEVFDASSDLHQGEMEAIGPQDHAPTVDHVQEFGPAREGEMAEKAVGPLSPSVDLAASESFANYLNLPETVLDAVPDAIGVIVEHERASDVELVQQEVLESISSDVSEPVFVEEAVPAEAVLQPEAERPAAEAVFSEQVNFEPEPSAELLAANYSFAQPPSLPTPKQALLMHWGVLMGVGLLGLLFGLQTLLYGRDRIAASWPVTKPILQSACGWLGCSVQALRRIDSVAIDSSSLSVARNDDYHLSVVLKNHAMVDLAMPALEFVLTDADEQALYRRVLLPADFGGASRLLFAGREWATTVDLQVQDSPMKSRIVGYRVLAFYP
jgi:predicted Zn finger-like uncharacterized protein